MEEPREKVNVLSVDQIVSLNRFMIGRTGGTFNQPKNLLHPDPINWVLDAIQHPVMFNVDHYPTIFHKAAILAWQIITRHTFYDGNKRTGMLAMQVFLLINNWFLAAHDLEIEEKALEIVAHRENGMTVESLREWIEKNTEVHDLGA